MTMPTSPLWDRVEVRFPSEFTARYMTPLSYFGSPPSMFGGAVDGVEWPPNDGFANDNDLFHKQKQLEAVEEVARAVRNRQVQRMNQMTHNSREVMCGTHDEMEGAGLFDVLKTGATKLLKSKTGRNALLKYAPGMASKAYGMVKGAFNRGDDEVVVSRKRQGDDDRGGARYGGTPTTIEGAPVLAGRGLRGGVMRTLAGRQHVVKRLQSRVGELNAREAVSQGVPPPAPAVSEIREDADEIEAISEFLDILDDNFTSGAIDAEAISAARGLLKTVTRLGYMIPQNLLTPLLRQVESMLSNIEAVANSTQQDFMPSGERRKRLRTIFQVLERVRTALEALSSVSDLSARERQMAMMATLPEIHQEVASQRARKPRSLPPPVPLPRGQTGYVYPYPTQEPGSVRPARRA